MPAFYIPARDSRHRVACIALYRALLRQVPRVALPNDLTTPTRPGWTNPILYLIRSGFRRNKADTSPRLVTSALKSGYRFLTLLQRAHDASSPQHGEIVSFLRERQAKFPAPPPPPAPEQEEAEGAACQTHQEQEPTRPSPSPYPIFKKVSAPDDPYPVYETTVRPVPFADLRGDRRRVPHIDLAGSFPFMRISKPQSHFLSNVLRRKFTKRQDRILHMMDLAAEARPAARTEDMWEELLAEQAKREGVELFGTDEEAATAAAAAAGGGGGREEIDEEEDFSKYALSLREFERSKIYGAAPGAGDGTASSPSQEKKGKGTSRRAKHMLPFERTVWEHGVRHIKVQLDEEHQDMLARTRAMINLVREERRLAEEEKAQKLERKRKAWEERMKATQEQAEAGQTPTPTL